MRNFYTLFCLCFLSVSLFAADNFLRGFQFDGATGLQTGAQLEDLVTKARFADGAVDPSNTNRIFDTNVFTNMNTGGVTNLITIKEGGITEAMLAGGSSGDKIFGTVTMGTSTTYKATVNGSLTVNGDFLVTSNDLTVSYNGYPKLTLNTNMVTSSAASGTLITIGSFTEAFDSDLSTTTSWGDGNVNQAYQIDLGAVYCGFVNVKVEMYNAGAALAFLDVGYGLNDLGLASGVIRNGGVFTHTAAGVRASIAYNSAGAGTSTNLLSRPFAGRYISLTSFGLGTSNRYSDISVYGTTNNFRNFGGSL